MLGSEQRKGGAWVTKTAMEAQELRKRHPQQSTRCEKKRRVLEVGMRQKSMLHLCLEASRRYTAKLRRKESLAGASLIDAKNHRTNRATLLQKDMSFDARERGTDLVSP